MTTIILPYLMPGLNGKDGLIRENPFKVKAKKQRLFYEIKSQLGRGCKKYKNPVTVEWIRHTSKPMDWDNHCASFKHVGDVLVSLGVIHDDKPACITKFIVDQVIVRKANQYKMVINIYETI